MSRTVDILEAAAILKVERKTVEKLIHTCAIPAAQIGRKYVMMEKDVLDYVENLIVKQTSERMKRPTTSGSRGLSRAGSSTS